MDTCKGWVNKLEKRNDLVIHNVPKIIAKFYISTTVGEETVLRGKTT